MIIIIQNFHVKIIYYRLSFYYIFLKSSYLKLKNSLKKKKLHS